MRRRGAARVDPVRAVPAAEGALGHADDRAALERPGQVGLSRLDDVVLLGGIVAAALFLFVPRRYALALPAFVLAYFVIAIQPIQAGPHGMEQAAAGALFEGIRRAAPRLDRPRRADAHGRRALDGEDESLHRANERVLQPLGRARLHARRADAGRAARDGCRASTPKTGVLDEARRERGRAGYVLTDGSVALDGKPIAARRAARDDALRGRRPARLDDER